MSPVADYNMASYMLLAADSPDMLSLLRTFFGCLANGLQYLHDSKIRHRDIKPENILVKENMVFLTDFGISLDWESLSRSTTTTDTAKTPLYCAPEVANYQPRNCSSDIWSLGCVFLEMTTILKLQKIADMHAYFEERSGSYRYYSNIENALKWMEQLRLLGLEGDNAPLSWITKMLDLNPSSRPTAFGLVSEISGRCAGDMAITVSFCGSCCKDEVESSPASESAGELWVEDEHPSGNTINEDTHNSAAKDIVPNYVQSATIFHCKPFLSFRSRRSTCS
jgi:serine/threonine protein kinase